MTPAEKDLAERLATVLVEYVEAMAPVAAKLCAWWSEHGDTIITEWARVGADDAEEFANRS